MKKLNIITLLKAEKSTNAVKQQFTQILSAVCVKSMFVSSRLNLSNAAWLQALPFAFHCLLFRSALDDQVLLMVCFHHIESYK